MEKNILPYLNSLHMLQAVYTETNVHKVFFDETSKD